MIEVHALDIAVTGRPAPQGSKKRGQYGQMIEASPYLRPWRAAIREAVFARYKELGIPADDLKERPVFVGAVKFGARFYMPPEMPIDEPPDMDKLLRAVWDVLTQTRVWEDDGRVTRIKWLEEVQCAAGQAPGADMIIQPATVRR